MNVVVQNNLFVFCEFLFLWLFVAVVQWHRIWWHMPYKLKKHDFYRHLPHNGEGWEKWHQALLQSTVWTFLFYEEGPDRLASNGRKQSQGLYLIKLGSQSLSYLPCNDGKKSQLPVLCSATKYGAHRPSFLMTGCFILNWTLLMEELDTLYCVTAK